MKRFMYASVGVLCLMFAVAVGYHLGSQTAQAQAPEPISGYSVTGEGNMTYHYVMLSNGDVYQRRHASNWATDPAVYVGNFWNTPPVPTEQSTWGNVKGLYDKKGD